MLYLICFNIEGLSVYWVANEFLIYLLLFLPSKSEDCEECGDYIRHVLSLVPGSLAAVSLLIVLVFQASPIKL